MSRALWLSVAIAIVLPVRPCMGTDSDSYDRGKLLQFIEQAEKAYKKVTDYTAMFTKQERIKGELRKPDTFFLKFQKPFKVYLKWPKGEPNAGMEAIYVPGENNGKVLVHTSGLADIVLPAMEIEIDSDAAKQNNRHPVTHVGIGYFLERFSRDIQRADQDDEITVYFRGTPKLGGRRYHEVEMFLHPRQGNPGYYAYRSVIYFDVENKLPTHMLFYNWENQLDEFYAYKDVVLNPGLTDQDFDPKNEDYNFGLFPIRLGKPAEAVPVEEVMAGCDGYAKVAIPKRGLTKLIAYGPSKIYYLGYKAGEITPHVVACVAKTTSWLHNERFLVGATYDGEHLRISDVVLLNRDQVSSAGRKLLKGNQFLSQFRGKSVDDDLAVGKDLTAVKGAEAMAANWAGGIRAAGQQLKAAFDNVELRKVGAEAPKVQFQAPPSGKPEEKGKEQKPR